jgi:hypothetical protein
MPALVITSFPDEARKSPIRLSTSLLHRLLAPLLHLNPLHKIINHTRPTALLAPEPQTLILHRLRHESQRLTPQVPVDSFLPLGVQELQPKRQEIRPALPHPRETGLRIRQRSPELLRVLEINSFLAVFDEQRESVVVDGFVLLHGPARRELGVLDVLGDFAEGVAVCFEERAGDESFARDLA